jgi:hypothetical protein
MEARCTRICVTPTRNESWILKPFLTAAKCWADHVIVADQASTDGTLELLQATPGVDVILNDSPRFDELHRQRLLLHRARMISGKRVLLALDADEALSANCLNSKEWEAIGAAPAGTILRFRWVNILPGFQQAWIPPERSLFGFVDDESNHFGTRIHNPRLPCPQGAPVLDLEEIMVLHFQYVAWERMLSKQRWYMAWEHASHREKSALDIFREYHHMSGSWNECEIHPIDPSWLADYERLGIDYRSIKSEPLTWWDQEIVKMLREHGPHFFRKLAIWNHDWNAVAAAMGQTEVSLADPRSHFETMVHRLLTLTQRHRANWPVRAFEHFLRLTGW